MAWHYASHDSRIARFEEYPGSPEARWQSGYAAACKAVDAGSIPTLASIFSLDKARVAKLVDARDLKSLDLKVLPVRVRPRAPSTARLSAVFRTRNNIPTTQNKIHVRVCVRVLTRKQAVNRVATRNAPRNALRRAGQVIPPADRTLATLFPH